jgi:hypothetical protein
MIFDDTVPSQYYSYQKKILQHLIFFCKNEACVNCDTHNVTKEIFQDLIFRLYIQTYSGVYNNYTLWIY